MSTLKKLVNKVLGRLRMRSKPPRPPGKVIYKDIALTSQDISNEAYKDFLGGGSEHWGPRGGFQLFFLKKMGLLPRHRLLDVGCGPIRAGIHFIDYLNAGNYVGVDHNRDFIQAAQHLVATNQLTLKMPVLVTVDNFDFAVAAGTIDFAMAFSVLNHCDRKQQNNFFATIANPLRQGARVYVSHASWFHMTVLSGKALRLTNQFDSPRDVSDDLDIGAWGWTGSQTPFPIVELTRL